MFKSRKYRSGARWAFWRWTETPSGYIDRLHLVQTPVGSIMLHWLNAPDPEPFLHDHPVSFVSIILRGWYCECRQRNSGAGRWLRHRWGNRLRARPSDRHSIRVVSPGGCLTLCLMGPKRQEWGFFTPAGKISWREYNREKYYGESKLRATPGGEL